LQVQLVQLGYLAEQVLQGQPDCKESPELLLLRAAQVLLGLKVQPDHKELLVKVLQVPRVQLVRPVPLVLQATTALLVQLV
jgi:hypothetical protein